MQTTETRGAIAPDRTMLVSPGADDNNGILSRPAVALLAAGAIGFAVGAVIWKYRRGNSSKFGSFDRAVDNCAIRCRRHGAKASQKITRGGLFARPDRRACKKKSHPSDRSGQRARLLKCSPDAMCAARPMFGLGHRIP